MPIDYLDELELELDGQIPNQHHIPTLVLAIA